MCHGAHMAPLPGEENQRHSGTANDGTLPEPFAGWFAAQGWTPRPHQLAMLEAARARRERAADRADRRRQDAGRVPAHAWSIWRARPRAGLHTLYVSPLKALATDIARNLTRAGRGDAACRSRIETRTGDTPGQPPRAAARGAAEHPADHAGKPGACCCRCRTRRRCSPGCAAW